jgi:predicted acyltransferase
MCLDIFRGLAVAGMIVVDNPGDDANAYWPIRHAEWNGWTPADFIFPSFLFLAGVSIAFSFSARLRDGESPRHILLHAIKRSLILIVIGLFVNGFPLFHLSDFRFEGVLQRIAICYLACAILFLRSGWRGHLAAIIACLLGYWALVRFVPVPGFGMPGRDIPFLDPNRNIVAWVDRKLFMGHLFDGTRDPEGILSTIPAIATTLTGVLTGQWLRSSRGPRTKAFALLCVGLLCLAFGRIWDVWFPINKNLWTSSFVVFSGGFALVVLSLLYWVLEIRNWRGWWTLPILVFGMNPIAGFVADSFVYGPAYSLTTRGPDGSAVSWLQYANAHLLSLTAASPQNASLLYSLGAALFCWVLLWMLWRKRVFLKV